MERENETKKLLLEKINRPYSEEEKKHMWEWMGCMSVG